MQVRAFLVVIALAACSSFNESNGSHAAHDASSPPLDAPRTSDALDATRPSDATSRDAGKPFDAHPTTDARDAARASDSSGVDAPVDAASRADRARPDAGPHDAGPADAASETGLSPLLALPAPDAATCNALGNVTVCPLGMCLIADRTSTGRCQECSPHGGNCGSNLHGPCTVAEDCDSLFSCYDHICVSMCPLDAGVVCGAATCTNVGNPYEGVCVP